MSNSVQKAVKLLQSAKYSNSKLDDIYDFLYASYISGEAEQMHDERKVKNALRHYEGLDGEMEYKSKSLNKRLASIKEEIQSIKAMLTVTGYDRSFTKKVEALTNSRFVRAEDTGEGQLYYFDICDTCELFEIEVAEEEDGEKTWLIGNREYYSERDLLKFVGKIADEYRRYR